LPHDPTLSEFEQIFLPYLNSAYNLARWLTPSEADARDVVQEAYLRAFRFFSGFRGDNPRAWLFAIVRNTSRNLHADSLPSGMEEEYDEERHLAGDMGNGFSDDPAVLVERSLTLAQVERAIRQLPREFQETMILRELEGFSYQEIADITSVPIGTVMSRLARARRQLRITLGVDPEESGA